MPATAAVTSFTQLPGIRRGNAVRTKFNMLLTLTAHTDATLAVTLTADQMKDLDGLYLYKVVTRPGGTAPTDASDLAITDSRGLTLLSATSHGLNLIDATTTKQGYAEDDDGVNQGQLLHRAYPLTFTVTNNAVNSAIILLDLELGE